jgi:sn-glycerol 3-phosphate transport system ATP-binding protein/multiple sugar transport system ATP-binding protein
MLAVPTDKIEALKRFAGRRVEIGLRPEHFLAGDAAEISVPVDMAELLGPTTLVHFTLEGVSCSAMLSPEHAAAEGQTQSLRIARDRMSLFDPDTGRAI